MARTEAQTVNGYLSELPPERLEAIDALRRVILDHLPEGFEESMQFGIDRLRYSLREVSGHV